MNDNLKCSKKSEKNSILCVLSTTLFTLISFAFIWLFVEEGGENYQYIKTVRVNKTTEFVNGETFKYDNINSINIKMDDCKLTITETDGNLVEITSTIENTGVGIITQPIVWVKNNTLHFDQGIKAVRGTKSEGELVVKVPKNSNLNFDIFNGDGDVFFDIEEPNELNINSEYGNLEIRNTINNFLRS